MTKVLSKTEFYNQLQNNQTDTNYSIKDLTFFHSIRRSKKNNKTVWSWCFYYFGKNHLVMIENNSQYYKTRAEAAQSLLQRAQSTLPKEDFQMPEKIAFLPKEKLLTIKDSPLYLERDATNKTWYVNTTKWITKNPMKDYIEELSFQSRKHAMESLLQMATSFHCLDEIGALAKD